MGLSTLEKFALLDTIRVIQLAGVMLSADTDKSHPTLSGSCSKAMVLAQHSHARECWSWHTLHNPVQKKMQGKDQKGLKFSLIFPLHLLFQSVTCTNFFS